MTGGTAEEFHGHLVADALTLDEAARRHAEDGELVRAVAAAWGCDITTVQACLWERVMIASRAPQRQYFQAAAPMITALVDADESASGMAGTAETVLKAGRQSLAREFDAALRREVESRWTDVSYLSVLPAPTAHDFADARATRLEGQSPALFVSSRLKAAHDSMLVAQSDRIRNAIGRAIQAAYDADFHVLEGYLVESALAAGDERLITAYVRSDLVAASIAELPGVPEDFARAVGVIRSAMCAALSEADGGRLNSRFLAI